MYRESRIQEIFKATVISALVVAGWGGGTWIGEQISASQTTTEIAQYWLGAAGRTVIETAHRWVGLNVAAIVFLYVRRLLLPSSY